MIEILSVNFDNYLSYGAGNEIDFTKHRVTILSAENGSGKSSIATVLEDALYSKNSKGVLKADLQNRYLPGKPQATVCFRIGEDFYELTKSSTKTTLFKNGDDISGHTATQTHKQIESIFGMDFSTFTKLVYQSLNSNMDFLNETDANRKKFLIQLLNLEKYSQVEEELKTEAKKLKTDLDKLEGEEKGLLAFSITIPEELVEMPVPEWLEDNETALLDSKISEVSEIKNRNQKALSDYNRLIKLKTDAESKYKTEVENQRKKLELVSTLETQEPAKVSFDKNALQELRRRITELETTRADLKKTYQRFKNDASKTECHVCRSKLDTTMAENAMNLAAAQYKALTPELTQLTNELNSMLENEKISNEYSIWERRLAEAKASVPSEPSMPEFDEIVEPVLEEVPNVASLVEAKRQIAQLIAANRQAIKDATTHNNKVIATKEVIKQAKKQIDERDAKLAEVSGKTNKAREAYTDYMILAKSTKELVSYKIESTIKQFEANINKYLTELSDGRFLVSFKIDGAKLVVRVLSDGVETKVSSLSSGEYSLMQIATLLAIRANVAKQGINLLILDEVISVLSDNNKDKLVQILLKEPYNSIIVSHGYINSECGYMTIVKKDNISKVETEW